MKDEFLEFLDTIMNANKDLTDSLMTDNIQLYIEALKEKEIVKKVELTDNGKAILKFMQETQKPFKSAQIADGIGITGRSASGSMRKLVNDGFVEKIGDKPAMYMITEKGKGYKID